MTRLFAGSLICGTLSTTILQAQLKQPPGTSLSDALFDPSRVIPIEIRLDPKDWHALRISHRAMNEQGRISLTEKGYQYCRGDIIIDGQVVRSVGIRKKGSWGSTASHRPALKIKFDEYVKDQQFGGLDMMTLNNCLGDPTKANQFLVSSFMSKAGVPTPRSNLARIIVNGEDLGVYANVESIGKSFIKRHFGNAEGDLYEPQNGADFTTNTLRLGLTNRIERKWGKDERLAHVKKLIDVLTRPGPVSLQEVESLVDLDAFITFWAAEVLIGSFDGYSTIRNNIYIYRDERSGKIFFIPWGRDAAFKDPGEFLPATVPKSVKASGSLCRRLWELPEIRERYRREMRRLLADVWEEKAMLSELRRVRALCRDDPSVHPARVKELEDGILRFIEGRRNEVQIELDGPAPEWTYQGWNPPTSAPGPSPPPMLVEGSFSAVITEEIPWPTGVKDFWREGSAKLQFTVDGKTHTPLVQFGARVALKVGDQQWTNIRIVALDASGDLRWNLGFRIDPYRVQPDIALRLATWEMTSVLIQGVPNTPLAQTRWVDTGTLELTQVATNLGGTISGKFKINTPAFEEKKP